MASSIHAAGGPTAVPLPAAVHPVDVQVEPALVGRNRLTCAFRPILAVPHLLLVGAPVAAVLMWPWATHDGSGPPFDGTMEMGGGGGVLGAVAGVAAVIAWFAIVFGVRHPRGLWELAAYYLRWRVRAVAYAALLRDEYPPFGEGAYPARTRLAPPAAPRNRLTVAFRLILAVPHLLAVWALGVAWFVTTVVAWFAVVFTGTYPERLYHFGVGVLRWNTRVEAYVLLLRDEYPPFSLT